MKQFADIHAGRVNFLNTFLKAFIMLA